MNNETKELQPMTNQAGALASLAPKTLEEALKFCEFLATSTVIPKDFVGKSANIFVAVQWGMELGLAPLQAMQNIAVINGRPTLWGDAMLALVMSSPLCLGVEEFLEGEGEALTAVCRVSRKGSPVHEQRFSVADAKKAELLGKQGPWRNYPARMLAMRARSWALRDKFPDVLKGMPCAEEVGDYELHPGEGYQVVTGKGKPEVQSPKATQPDKTTTQQEEKPATDVQATITSGGVALIKRSLENKGIKVEEFCEHMKVTQLEDILAADINRAMADIKKWEAQP